VLGKLTDGRQRHILLKHPDLLPEYIDYVAETLAEPDEVRRDSRFPATRDFARWCESVKGGKLVVVVVSDLPPMERYGVVTAYIARKLTQGVTEWKRAC